MPMTKYQFLPRLALAGSMGLPFALTPAEADDGHDHGATPATSVGAPSPRFAATSELFELGGAVDGRQLRLYLDRFDDNAPVAGARLDLEVGDAKVALTEHAPGEFAGTLAADLKPGTTAVTATVMAGTDTDLLAGELDVHEEDHAAEEEEENAHSWRAYAAWIAAGVAALGTLGWAARRTRMGGAA